MRENETRVAEALAKHFGTSFRNGEDPPDVYLKFDDGDVAVEISALAQQVIGADGRSRPRRSDEEPSSRLADLLNDELGPQVPENRFVLLDLRSPLANLQKAKAAARTLVLELLRHSGEGEARMGTMTREGDLIKATFLPRDQAWRKSVAASVSHKAQTTDNAMIDADDFDPDLASLCVDCARHPSLKAFISENANGKAYCGVCFRSSSDAVVCDIADRVQLENLVRALIRFYYDETDYNGHFGGESPEEILCGDNPILDVKHSAANRPRIDFECFVSDLAAQLPMPAYDAGIWIYRQNEAPPLAQAISKNESSQLRVLRKRLEKENYFALEADLLEVIDKIGTRVDVEVPRGRRFYRARIGVSARFVRFDEFNARAVRLPYQGNQLGAPPAPLATAGRLNRAGVSFLYLATTASTAACEVRRLGRIRDTSCRSASSR